MLAMKRLFCAAAFALSLSTGHAAEPVAALGARQADDFLAGRGMGLARAAELNGYPGPAHVLELADELELTAAQREHAAALVAQVREDAQRLGAEIVAGERQLERLFAQGLARPETLRPLLDHVSMLHGELRAIHLAAHIAQRDALDGEQIARYRRLRAEHPRPGGDEPMRRHH